MNILVTGGAGDIGAVLAPALLQANHEVTVLDSFMFKQASLAASCIDPRSSTCAVQSRRFSSGCEPRPASFAPAGSNRSSRGGNEMAEAFGVESH
ncbi:MAG: NAD-dependent epimerase/dehydratase family protein [Betaproteobacteria bacterium]|nr:NAD-dependent epimerase/dehydratase family protein [Betaproteobacteria bacterium]